MQTLSKGIGGVIRLDPPRKSANHYTALGVEKMPIGYRVFLVKFSETGFNLETVEMFDQEAEAERYVRMLMEATGSTYSRPND